MVYKSKIDWWMHLIFISFFAITLVSVVLMVVKYNLVLLLNVALLVLLDVVLLLPLYLSTKYYLLPDGLLIICGLFKTKINYEDIKKIEKSRCILASAALSIDRIKITYKMDEVLISPVNRDEFIENLNKMLQVK